MVRKNRGLRNTDEVDYGKGGGGVRKQVFRVKRLLRMSFFLIANACKLHLQLQQSSLHLFPHSVVPI